MTIKVPVLVTFTMEVEDVGFEAMQETLGIDNAIAALQEHCGNAMRISIDKNKDLAFKTDALEIDVDEWAHSPSW